MIGCEDRVGAQVPCWVIVFLLFHGLGRACLLFLFLLLELGAPVWPVLLVGLLLQGPIPHWWGNNAVALLLLARGRAGGVVFIHAVVVLFFFSELGELRAAVEPDVGVLLVVLLVFWRWR